MVVVGQQPNAKPRCEAQRTLEPPGTSRERTARSLPSSRRNVVRGALRESLCLCTRCAGRAAAGAGGAVSSLCMQSLSRAARPAAVGSPPSFVIRARPQRSAACARLYLCIGHCPQVRPVSCHGLALRSPTAGNAGLLNPALHPRATAGFAVCSPWVDATLGLKALLLHVGTSHVQVAFAFRRACTYNRSYFSIGVQCWRQRRNALRDTDFG